MGGATKSTQVSAVCHLRVALSSTAYWTEVAACELLIKRVRNYDWSLTAGNPVNCTVGPLFTNNRGRITYA